MVEPLALDVLMGPGMSPKSSALLAAVALTAIGASIAPTTAHAQPSTVAPPAAPLPEAPPPEPETRLYGLPILGLDVAAGALIAGSMFLSPDPDEVRIELFGLGAALFLASGPIVHGGHGHSGRAVGSVALRVGLPLVGALVGVKSGDPDDDKEWSLISDDQVASAGVGMIVGAISASVIDSLLLAREEVETGPRYQVQVSGDSERTVVSLGGSF